MAYDYLKSFWTGNLGHCSIFWDIENVKIPFGVSARDAVAAIRDKVIKHYSLIELDFYCVCDWFNIPTNIAKQLHSAGVTLIHIPTNVKNGADEKIKSLMTRFVDDASNLYSPFSIVLLTGDVNFSPILRDIKRRHPVKVRLIHGENVAHDLLDCADSAFNINDLAPAKEDRPSRAFNTPLTWQRWLVKVTGFGRDLRKNVIVSGLGELAKRYNGNFAEFNGGVIWLSFQSQQEAKLVATLLDGSDYLGAGLITASVVDNESRLLDSAGDRRRETDSMTINRQVNKKVNSRPKRQQSPTSTENQSTQEQSSCFLM